MANPKVTTVDSSIGKREVDSAGAPIGVVRMETVKSYAGVGELLQDYINNGNEGAWREIKKKIDYTYQELDFALAALEAETGFSAEIKARVAKGQKLLFKPNLVSIFNIDPQTHGPTNASTTCTEWPFVAALMRWFHDKLDITYHQMSLGEAATTMSAAASWFSMMNPESKPVTTEAAIEGKAGGFYGGWGFYFARKYLAETHDSAHWDDPMKGYDESVSGMFVPPGFAEDKLLVYDLNRIVDEASKGRDIKVQDAANFPSITLHKAIVGGDPSNKEDRKAYPGCILVNVPKMKVHQITLLTNVIKNLGIGLYPMQAAEEGGAAGFRWKYSVPYHPIPGLKGGIPHSVWEAQTDPDTGIPKRDHAGNYMLKKTAGISGTMIDIIKAVMSQDIFMIHVVDAVEAINLDHTGTLPGTREAEGLAFAGLDPVATDLLCARYMFSNVPLDAALQSGLQDGNGGCFPQGVPVAVVEGDNIVTQLGYDCPLVRDTTFQYAEKRGIGKRQYFVVGRDAVADCPLVSIDGHLGGVTKGTFSDLITKALYFDIFKVPWDLQKTSFSYLEAVDKLTGSSLKKEFLDAFDEDGDGVVIYDEFGKNGMAGPFIAMMGVQVSTMGRERLGIHHGSFVINANLLKMSDPAWNPGGHDIIKHFYYGVRCLVAMQMSTLDMESQDPFLPSLTWGRGKWPSYALVTFVQLGGALYGNEFPNKIGFPSMYGHALRYAELSLNGGRYTGGVLLAPEPDGAQNYITAVLNGEAKPLDFTLYVPPGYGTLGGVTIPNVEETTDPAKLLNAVFSAGKEVWP